MDKLVNDVQELLNKYPHLTSEEIKELRTLARNLSAECDNAIWDMQYDQKYYVGKVIVAKEDCLNNFRKGDAVEIEDIKDGMLLLDGLAYIEQELVDKYFV